MKRDKLITLRVNTEQWELFEEFAAKSQSNKSELLNAYIEECIDGRRKPSKPKKSTPSSAQTDSQVMEAIAALQAKVTELEAKLPA